MSEQSERYRRRAEAAESDMEFWRALFKKYAAHLGEECGFTFDESGRRTKEHRTGVVDGCTCGLDAALAKARDTERGAHGDA